jgi:hypothetical protein
MPSLYLSQVPILLHVSCRVRSLLCLGMLLPGSPNAQLQFVKQPGAVQAILVSSW